MYCVCLIGLVDVQAADSSFQLLQDKVTRQMVIDHLSSVLEPAWAKTEDLT